MLSGQLVVACEVAVEYFLALTWSPQVSGSLCCASFQLHLHFLNSAACGGLQAQWLRESEKAGQLQVWLLAIPASSFRSSALCEEFCSAEKSLTGYVQFH